MNCPHCQRLLYSRKGEKCGYCGGILPPDVRLSPREIAALNAEQQAIIHRRAIARAKEEEEEKRRRSQSDGATHLPPGGF
ncbi:MAG TPA: hypothetical protein VK956_11050 [Verrucomicrobium sp.]|nr:hypothetical protein [Verrucomicrobium sp.]